MLNNNDLEKRMRGAYAKVSLTEQQRYKRNIEREKERRELQRKNQHPSPCLGSCEATAFQIEIKNLKADIERAVLAEREACLKICEEQAYSHYYGEGADACVIAIKQRGITC